MLVAPLPTESVEAAVGASSVTFSGSLLAGNWYLFVSSTACWVAQAASPTASAGAGSMYVPAGVVLTLLGDIAAHVAVIQDSAGGKASLTRAYLY